MPKPHASRRQAPPQEPGHSIFRMPIEEIETRLTENNITPEMEIYFGDELDELRRMASDARRARTRAARPVVFLLPGIMGSTLGIARPRPLWPDTIWFDPLDAAFGRLRQLALPGRGNVISLQPFPFIYVGMRLFLEGAGFDVRYHAFDWRQPIGKLGQGLKARIESAGPGQVHIVAHSMGGLVARAAGRLGVRNLGTVVQIGTPNSGSFSPVEAFRGIHSFAATIAKLDVTANGTDLVEKIFGTFDGLAEMLPRGPIAGGVNWFDPAGWPASPKLAPGLLQRAASIAGKLADPGPKWFLIAGYGQTTIVRGEPDPSGGGFRFQRSLGGDGTVPLASAVLPAFGNRTRYVSHEHMTLTSNADVRQTTAQLLVGETRTALPSRPPSETYPESGWITEAQLRGTRERATRARSPGGASVGESVWILRAAIAPDAGDVGPAHPAPASSGGAESGPGDIPLVRGFTVSRVEQAALDIELVCGDIARVEAEAIVLPKFSNLDLGRAAQSVDALMDGALADLVARRMIPAGLGEVFILPTGRHPVRADFVAVAGLGPAEHFSGGGPAGGPGTLELVAANVLRTVVRAGVTEFAVILGTVPGGGRGETPAALRSCMAGFVSAIADLPAPARRRLRRILVCEADRGRFEEIRDTLHRLLREGMFEGLPIRLDEIELPPPPPTALRTLGAGAAGEAGHDPAYLIVRSAVEGPDARFDFTLIPSSGKAAAAQETTTLTKARFGEICALVASGKPGDGVTAQKIRSAGEAVAREILHPTVRAALRQDAGAPLIVVHDAEASRIPWECLPGADGAPPVARAGGLSRQYAAVNLSVAKWLESRRREASLRILLVVDPTGDLPGALAEGKAIAEKLGNHPGVALETVWQGDATKPRLLGLIASGQFDVIHYCGHAFFDPAHRSRSGLICAPPSRTAPAILSGADLVNLGELPLLLFLNACESARVRGGGASGVLRPGPEAVGGACGLAEAFLRSGVSSFVGTYWPVGDAAASDFAATFYARVLAGETVGAAVVAGRVALAGSNDWANYLHYGSPNFMLKIGGGR